MATRDSWFPASNQDAYEQLRIVLIGKTRTGKSATGNTLIGEDVFESKASPNSVTTQCKVETKERFGKKIEVVDTPEFLDSNMPPDELVKQLVSCTRLACPGVHAFLLLIRLGDRYNEKDEKAIELIKHIFCEKIVNHAVVVFTGKETLVRDEQNLQEYISQLPRGLQNTIRSCRGGYDTISNIGSRDEREEAARTILNKVEGVVSQNGGESQCYKAALFDEIPEKIGVVIDRILKGTDGIQDKIRLVNEEIELLTGEDRYIQRQRAKLEKIVYILRKIHFDTIQDAFVLKVVRYCFTSITDFARVAFVFLLLKFMRLMR